MAAHQVTGPADQRHQEVESLAAQIDRHAMSHQLPARRLELKAMQRQQRHGAWHRTECLWAKRAYGMGLHDNLPIGRGDV